MGLLLRQLETWKAKTTRLVRKEGFLRISDVGVGMITRRTLFGRLAALVAGATAAKVLAKQPLEEYDDEDDLDDVVGEYDFGNTMNSWGASSTLICTATFSTAPYILLPLTVGQVFNEYNRPRKLHKIEQFRRDVIAGRS